VFTVCYNFVARFPSGRIFRGLKHAHSLTGLTRLLEGSCLQLPGFAGVAANAPLEFDHLASPEGRKQNSPWPESIRAWENDPRGNRPEGAAERRALFPKITFVASDSMAFQKLTKLFLIRRPPHNQVGKGLSHRIQ
jgi:hypothetical protein